MWLIVSLVIVGVLLLVVELLLLPGISVAGIGAVLALAAAIFYSFINYGILVSSLVLAGIVILCIIAVVISLRSNTWQKLTLKSTIKGTSTPTPQESKINIGEQGITISRLAPMGKVRIGSVTLEARSVDDYIDPRQEIEVVEFDNTVVIVKKISKKNN